MRFLPIRLLFLVAALFVGCSGDEPSIPGKVVVLAVDAAETEVITTLIGRGELPNFDNLYSRGTSFSMTIEEPVFSPVVWTTVFTGCRPENHGIHSFTVEAGDPPRRVPVTSNRVKRSRLWEIAGNLGVTVGVVGHWVTWPADPVNGFLLSNYTWPPSAEFEKEWAPSADWDTIGARCYPPGIEESALSAAEAEEYFSIADFPNAGRLNPPLHHYVEKDLKYLNAGLALFDSEQPQLFTLYIESVDFFQHKLWLFHKYHEKETFGGSMDGLPEQEGRVNSQAIDLLGPMVAESYRLVDRVIGHFLERLDLSKDVLILVSDHGFQTYPGGQELHIGDDRRMEMPFWHSPHALLLAAGGPFRSGVDGGECRPEDVTPLVLGALGLPAGEDMDGRAPVEAFSRAFLKANPLATVASHEEGVRGDEETMETPFDEGMRDMLRSLGYID